MHDKEWSLLKDTKTVSDVIADDGSFAAFLDTVSVSDYDLTLQCAAMIYRLGLVDALGAKYGGAVDNHLIYSDCGSTLPATPKFLHLIYKKHHAEIGQAVTELSQYYVHYFHVAPSTADEDAQSAVSSAIHAAFDICF